jgi:hypothetical protein
MKINRDFAFCNYTIRDDAPPVFIVLDAGMDPRFADKPFVIGPPFARFYAGAPVFCDNIKIGSFCVIDNKAHSSFDEGKQLALLQFASLASDLISQHKISTYVSKYDPSLLSIAILQVLHHPLQHAMSWHSELSKAFSQLINQNNTTGNIDVQNLMTVFEYFYESSVTLQQSLEVTLRFASTVAHQQRNYLSLCKRKIGNEIGVLNFMREIQRIGSIAGYNESTWNYNADVVGSDTLIHHDPTTLSAIAGFLSLKHLTIFREQQWTINFAPILSDSIDNISASNESSFGPKSYGNEFKQVDGSLHMHCRFSGWRIPPDLTKGQNFKFNKHDIISCYDFQLINEILFNIGGHFEILHSEESSMFREFCVSVPTMYSFLSPIPSSCVLPDEVVQGWNDRSLTSSPELAVAVPVNGSASIGAPSNFSSSDAFGISSQSIDYQPTKRMTLLSQTNSEVLKLKNVSVETMPAKYSLS